MDKQQRKRKTIILTVSTIIILIIILLLSLSCTEDGIFYEDLHDYLSRNDYKELDVEDDFLKDTNLYDENFTCETITYENNILEFHNCNIKEEGKTEYKDYCTYDGKDFICEDIEEDKEEDLEDKDSIEEELEETPSTEAENNQESTSSNQTTTPPVTNGNENPSVEEDETIVPEKPSTINFTYSKTGYTKDNVTITPSSINNLLYCTTSSTDCTPNNNLSSEIKFTTEGNHKVCVLDTVTNETKCSETVTIDRTSPIINEPTITGTEGNNGWYKTHVLIKDNGAVDNLSGISAVNVDKPIINYVTAGETITITAIDKAGNVSKKEIEIKVDNINPTISDYTINGTPGENGWYKSDINITGIDATDNLSGVASVTPNQTTFTTETAGSNFIITATDNAGNTTQVIEEIKIDKTAPTAATINYTGTPGNNGWYKTDLLLIATGATDNISGIQSTNFSKSIINYDTSGEVITLITKDNAGNTTTTQTTVKVDRTKPTIDELVFFGAPGNDGWYLSDITVQTPTATDNLSGLKSITPSKTLFTEETNGTDLIITAEDNAGNVETFTKVIKIDKTLPVINDYNIVGDKGTNDWYIEPVTINNLTATDTGSGINTSLLNTISKTINYETTGENVELEVYDIAGNRGILNVPVKIDLTNPISGEIILTGDEGDNGWYTSEVEIDTTTGSDNISGIKDTQLNMDLVLGTKLQTTVTLITTDNAGRQSEKSVTVKIDKDIPKTGNIIIKGTLGDNDWYTSDVAIDFEDGTDAGSGHASTTVNLLGITTNTTGTIVSITTKDNAGMESTHTEIIKIDKDSPELLIKSDNQDIAKGIDFKVIDLFETPNYSISDGSISCTIENTKDLDVGSYSSTCTLTGGNGLTDSKTVNFNIIEDNDAIKTVLSGIKSTTGSYIKTGFNPSSNTRMVADFTFLGPRGTAVWLFSSRIAYANQMLGIAWNTAESLLQFDKVSYNLGSTAYKENTRHSIDLSKEALILDGVKYADPIDRTWQGANELYIFANNESGTVKGHTNGQAIMHDAQVYDNGVLKLDLIPVETVGGEFTFYDKVSETLLENVGTFIPIY